MSEEQTISTLRFASEAKKIQNHAKVNEVLDNQAQISRLMKEMEELKKQLEQQKAVNTNEMLAEMKEQLERERNEKEQQLKVRYVLHIVSCESSSRYANVRQSVTPVILSDSLFYNCKLHRD